MRVLGEVFEMGGKKFRVVEVIPAPYPPVVSQPPGCYPSSVGGGVYVEEVKEPLEPAAESGPSSPDGEHPNNRRGL